MLGTTGFISELPANPHILFLAIFGTAELLSNGSGGGQGPSPIAKPSGGVLPVQVIAQQWEFTYRYPTYGGVETPDLVVPVDREIAFHVTSQRYSRVHGDRGSSRPYP